MRSRPPIVLALIAIIATACAAAPAQTSFPPSGPSPAQPTPPPESGTSPGELAEIGLAQSTVSRAPATEADAASAAAAVNSLGADVYRLLGTKDENVVFSPPSIAFALGLVRPGARGQTAQEIDTVTYQVSSDEHPGWLNALDRALRDRSGTFRDHADKPVKVALGIANGAFAQDGLPLEQPYLDALASRLGTALRTLDFSSDPDAARGAINDWVAEETDSRIAELLAPNSVDQATALVLVNAMYLMAPWRMPFVEGMTDDAPFTRADGTVVVVPTMTARIDTTCGEDAGWRSIELPYAGEVLTMTIVVPDDLAEFERRFDAASLAAVFAAGREPCSHSVALPRFEVESRADLAETLSALGMRVAFERGGADFSGITTAAPLSIDRVVHQATLSVDEDGTEAAAATAVSVALSEGPEAFEVNRPFVFAVRDRATGAVLFLGRITDPSIGS